MRRRLFVMVFLAAMLAPALLVVGATNPNQAVEEQETAPALNDAFAYRDALLWLSTDSLDTGNVYRRTRADAGEAEAAPKLIRFTVTLAEDPEPETASQEATRPIPTESVVILAQSSLAALGAAAHVQAPGATYAPQAPIVLEPAAANQAAPTWLTAVAWSVFLASLGILFTRLVGPAALALYARLSLDEVAHHPRRSLILQAVKAHPGASLEEVRRVTGIPGGALRHHLDQLAARGLLREASAGRETRWFEPGGRIPAAEMVPNGARRVLATIGNTPGLTTPEVAKRLEMTVQSAWKHLRTLVAAGLARPLPVGKAHAWQAIAT